MLSKLLRKTYHVRPVRVNDPSTKWEIVEVNTIQALIYDLRTTSLRIALHNFCILMDWEKIDNVIYR